MKKLQSLFFAVFTGFLIVACQPESEVSPITFEATRRVVKAEDIPKVTSTLLEKLGLSNGTQRLAMNSSDVQSEFEIDWDKILQLVDSSGRQTYTFNIADTDDDPHTFYNLVLRFNEQGDPFTPFVVKYEMSEESFQEYLLTGSMEKFVGNITQIPISVAGTSSDNSANNGPDAPRLITENPDCPGQTIDVTESPSGGGGPGGAATTTTYVATTTTYVETCDFYKVFLPFTHYDGNGNYTYSDKVFMGWYIDCYTETVEHTEVNSSGNCDLGDGEIPILEPDELKAYLWKSNICETDAFKQNECVQEIWNKLMDKDLGFISLKRFSGDNPIVKLCMDIQDLGTTSKNGDAGLSGSLSEAKVNIRLNSQTLNRPKLSIARTIIHEMIHAEIHAMIVEAGYYPNLQEFASNYQGDDNFAMLWEYVKQYRVPGKTGWQHEFMADYYVQTMAESLREIYSELRSDTFHNYVDGSSTYFNNETGVWNWNDFFTAIAWNGLQSSEEWKTGLDEELKRKYEFYIQQLNDLEVNSASCT